MPDALPPIKLLIDEDLSPWVALRLREDEGLDAIAVRDRGMLGATDAEVLAFAYGEDRVLVTANVADFLKLARAAELHPGIILVEDGDLPRADMLEVVQAALVVLRRELDNDLVNKVLRVSLDGTWEAKEVPPP